MSNVCNLVELVLADARDLGDADTLATLELAASRGVARGAVGLAGARDAAALDSAPLDFWFFGDDGAWPFARAVAFAGVDAARALFLSADDAARSSALDAGLQASAPSVEALERLLP